MTTLSAGAAAGLLVALMVMSTSDGHGALLSVTETAHDLLHPGDPRVFDPQPDPPAGSRPPSAPAPRPRT